ncbi:MAG: radical SAM family heme chaperone HemW [Flavobacteriales bacterium]|nr:radical SAM family heme chaperone HemW [Flavobacteriales bacterium]
MAGIYIHIPFCKQRCYYCDFHFTTSLKNKDAIINAIIFELETRKTEITEEVKTIYFGGGTPTVIASTDIVKILDAVYQNYDVIEEPEITIEANPDDINVEKLKELKKTAINRFSVGIQSFHQKDLEFMNRAHDKNQAEECISLIKDAGWDNITIDLIYGVPNQSEQDWRYNLNRAFELGVPHISAYALTVEDKTPLNKLIKSGKYPNVSDEKALSDFKVLIDETKKHGFIQYEISNFGKENYFSRHNSSYWQGEKYLGVGPSAHSFNGQSRRWNLANNKLYLEGLRSNSYFEAEVLTATDSFNEYLMTGLRTIWGVSLDRVLNDYGEEFYRELLTKVDDMLKNGKLVKKGDVVLISEAARFQTDGITSDLFVVD